MNLSEAQLSQAAQLQAYCNYYDQLGMTHKKAPPVPVVVESSYDKLKKLYGVDQPEADEHWFKLLFHWRQIMGHTGLSLPMVSGLSGDNAWTIFNKMQGGKYGHWHISFCYDIKTFVINLLHGPGVLAHFLYSTGSAHFNETVPHGFALIDSEFSWTQPTDQVIKAWVEQAERLVSDGTYSRGNGCWNKPTNKELELGKFTADTDYWNKIKDFR